MLGLNRRFGRDKYVRTLPWTNIHGKGMSTTEQISKNLRTVWNEKKHELDMNQVEACDRLGWTQGALSQYLNGHTKFSTDTVIKLADFFQVDPRQINPDIVLPATVEIPLLHTTSEPDKKIRNTSRKNNTIVPSPTQWSVITDDLGDGSKYLVQEYKSREWWVLDKKEDSTFLVQLNSSNKMIKIKEEELPLRSEMKRCYIVIAKLM